MSERFSKARELVINIVVLVFYIIWAVKFVIFMWNKL